MSQDGWVKFDPLTHTYRTKDGTAVAAEVVDNVQCLADVFRVADIRADQRKRPNVRGEAPAAHPSNE